MKTRDEIRALADAWLSMASGLSARDIGAAVFLLLEQSDGIRAAFNARIDAAERGHAYELMARAVEGYGAN